MISTEILGAAPEAIRTARRILDHWEVLGLRGSLLARNLDTGQEMGFAPDRVFPLASVVKAPQALVVADRVATGRLDGAARIRVAPDTATPGPTGLSRFRHPAEVAVSDLLYLSLSFSDNAAADALFDLVPPAEVTQQLHEWGHEEIVVRHRMVELYQAVARWSENDMRLALRTAAAATTAGGGHTLPVLDVTTANVGSARALVGLLTAIWEDSVSVPAATAHIRDLLDTPVTRHRLGAELVSDSITVRSKTGSFLHSRHEVGVVEDDTGARIACAALTESTIAAQVQPEVDRAIGHAARLAVEVLRD